MSTGPGADSGDAPAVFRKPAKRNKNVRARPSSLEEEPTADAADGGNGESAVVRVAKSAKPNPLVQSTGSSGAEGGGKLFRELAHASDVRITQYDNKATASNEQDVARSHDAQAQYEAARAMWHVKISDAGGP